MKRLKPQIQTKEVLKMKNIAIIQIDLAYGEPEINQKVIKAAFGRLEGDVDIVVLPEMWNTAYDLSRLEEIADVNAEKSIAFLSTLAKKYQVNIIGGSVAMKTEDKMTNTLLVINKDGTCIKKYSKAHLFRLMEEEKYLTEGNEDGLFRLDDLDCAGVICYDIRFPEWIRSHMLDQASLLFVVAEWPKQRIEHWRSLLIARAIENQCYVIACNRVGEDPNNEFGGHSMIIDPWGRVVEEAEDEAKILYGKIDPSIVEETRKRIPVFDDRRVDLYKI